MVKNKFYKKIVYFRFLFGIFYLEVISWVCGIFLKINYTVEIVFDEFVSCCVILSKFPYLWFRDIFVMFQGIIYFRYSGLLVFTWEKCVFVYAALALYLSRLLTVRKRDKI